MRLGEVPMVKQNNQLTLAMLPFLTSFMIRTVLASVIQHGTLPCSRQSCNCRAIRSWKLRKFFNQYPCTWSGPGAFQFDTFFTCLFTLSTSIWNPSCCCTHLNSFTPVSHSACRLCCTGQSQIPPQKVLASVGLGSACVLPAFPSNSLNNWRWLVLNNLFWWNCLTLSSYLFTFAA